MRIPIDRQSPVPLYQQIEQALRQSILSGSLAAETRLPGSRQLAADLGVSRITVKNAYEALESDGLISSREGAGTFVTPPAVFSPGGDSGGSAWPLWQQSVAAPAVFSQQLYPADLPYHPPHPDPVIFTGVGDARLFPVRDFYQAMQQVMRQAGPAALAYEEFNPGYGPLRETIARVLGSQGIRAHPDQVLITSGSQQALALVCQVLLRPGDTILVEQPTYNLALELFRSLNLTIVGVPVDEHGLQVEQVEPLLRQHSPRLIYTIPNFHNPTGTCLPAARRRQLVALADRYNVPILEDDYAGDLRYDGRAQPAIKALDPGGRVIYTGTFSKMLMPGLRIGFLLAEGPIFNRLLHSKWVHDLTTPTLIQRVLDEYVTVGRYQAHLRRSCRANRVRRDAMLVAVRQHLPAEVRVSSPQGGLYLWLRLPDGVSSLKLLRLAMDEGVDFTPGSWFYPVSAEGDPYLRLNFAIQEPERIHLGLRRLATALRKYG